MDPATRKRIEQFAQQHHGSGGRSLSELIETQDSLKGAESQRLRSYFSTECMEPGRDLDAYGKLLAQGNLAEVKADFARRVARHKSTITDGAGESSSQDVVLPETLAAQELYKLTWGPTRVPIYNLLGLMRIIAPGWASQHLAIAQFFIETAKVPVDAPDLSGTQALSHAISTKPATDFEFAQLLYDAGGDVNHRNRYGGTCAHEIVTVWAPQDKSVTARAASALEWFLDHNGSVDIDDNDGMGVRYLASRSKNRIPVLHRLIEESDRKRKELAKKDGCCALCGRVADETMKKCGRCKVARYCAPEARACQKLHWPHHKKHCVKVTDEFSFLGKKF
ncbi:MYND-type domain-containing protein [Favolaschia claudopus]|uniref:MYND-type domain-containing protein n=1 Tax=Favolaschia claudopus TaxID=2862362 RepID=A0AAW0E284_9AGAR